MHNVSTVRHRHIQTDLIAKLKHFKISQSLSTSQAITEAI